MHTPANLRSTSRVPWVDSCAGLPFLHVCAIDKDELRRALSAGIVVVPDDSMRHGKTVDAEKNLGIPRCLYFFVGRCCPGRVGSAVLSVEFFAVRKQRGAVSPFDTGGLYHDHLRLPWDVFPPGTKQAYLKEHSADLSQFQQYFTDYLSAFFELPGSYWSHPDKPIDGTRFASADDWRNWTFEVRFVEQTEISSAKWYFDLEAESEYLDLLADGLVDPLPDSQCEIASRPFEKAETDARNLASSWPGGKVK